ncbi:MAG: hypothetical protein Q8R76_09725 [Candidatus Omnitrophota bacterium]|nr:hypothetical protein [Candidatus Omnitrophota bacterium]
MGFIKSLIKLLGFLSIIFGPACLGMVLMPHSYAVSPNSGMAAPQGLYFYGSLETEPRSFLGRMYANTKDNLYNLNKDSELVMLIPAMFKEQVSQITAGFRRLSTD